MTASLGRHCFAEAFKSDNQWAINSLFAMKPYEEYEYLNVALMAAVQTKDHSMVDLVVHKFKASFIFNGKDV